MAGHEGHRAGAIAVGHRNPGVGRRGHARRYAGHDRERDPGRAQRLGLLTAATEHERVTAFQADHLAPGGAVLEQQSLDLGLPDRGTPALLAGVDQLGLLARAVERRDRNQPVMDDHVGAGDQVQGAASHQSRIARASPDEMNGHVASSRSACASSAAAPAASIRSAHRSPT